MQPLLLQAVALSTAPDSPPSMLTAGTNINELLVCWQGEKRNIRRKLT
ncbi:hypothetical protein [Yersinia aldovae]|nr:hypothetical protein [Yersinia aldovae]